MPKGFFLGFEGNDGAGKTKQSKRLLEYLGKRAIWTREPGGTPPAEVLRDVTLDKKYDPPLNGLSSYLAISSGRHHHVEQVIKPALQEGKIVICDRFHGSSFAYNLRGQQAPEILEIFDHVNDLVTGTCYPDLYIWLKVPLEVGLKRVRDSGKVTDRFDDADLAMRTRVYAGYEEFFSRCKQSYVEIDANRDVEVVFGDIVRSVKRAMRKGK